MSANRLSMIEIMGAIMILLPVFVVFSVFISILIIVKHLTHISDMVTHFKSMIKPVGIHLDQL